MEFRPCGDTGFSVQLGSEITRHTSRRVVALRAALEQAALPGIIETVPTYLSLLVHYDPLVTSQAELIGAIQALDISDDPAPLPTARSWRLPVCFTDADLAPDLDTVAHWAGITAEALISEFITTELFVYMLGFAPGQPYMGDLAPHLGIPRRKNPVARIPAGSVVTATCKTLIYPTANPTGWYVVGRTPVPIFDIYSDPPALLSAGDRVCLEPVDLQRFREIEAAIATGDYDPWQEAIA